MTATTTEKTQQKKTTRKKAAPTVKRKPRTSPSKDMGKDPFTQEEAVKLIDSTENLEERTLLVLGFTTGLKITEIASLEPINFDFPKGLVRIWDRRKHHYRNVYLTDDTIGEIRLLIDTRSDTAGPRLFPHTAKAVESRFQKLTLSVFGKSRSWESVRRTYISTCAAVDLPINIVAENTGETASSILKYYLAQPLTNARLKVNGVQLYPGNQTVPLKSDELKRILEKPYVEKLEKIFSERSAAKKEMDDLKMRTS